MSVLGKCVFKTHVGDHFAARLVAFSMVGSLLLLLKQLVAHSLVLERKLADQLAELLDPVFGRLRVRVAQKEQKLAKSFKIIMNIFFSS